MMVMIIMPAFPQGEYGQQSIVPALIISVVAPTVNCM